jgi:phosphotransferase system enzyme I (PtsI)
VGKKSRRYKGLAVSPGIGIGYVHVIGSETINFPKFWISDREIKTETARFQQALKKTQRELARIKEKLCKFQVGDQIRIIDTHQMLVNDEMLVHGTTDLIRQEKINAEWAFDRAIQKMRSSFPEGDPYFQERCDELAHLAQRVLQNLLGSEATVPRQFKKDSVIVTHDLSPADTAQMTRAVVQGFLTEIGGPTSHTAIVARALEIPAVVGIDGITHLVRDGDPILIDGTEGVVLLHPSPKELAKYRSIQKRYEHFDQLLLKEAHLPSVTQDGYHLRLAANMEIPDEIATIKSHGAEGIGLYRTEMLYTAYNRFPTEEEQFQIYRKILRRIAPHATTIRTLDIGGDKIVSDLEDIQSVNPALGLRAIRYCLKERNLLKNQIRAMLRASRYGPLKILIPMVTTVEELRQVKKVIADIKEELDAKKIRYDPNVKVGAMIEIPSAAIMADELAREVDFLSIGTNDLTQYTLAVDRANDEVSYLYEPLHPAILRLLKMVCDAGRSRNIEVSVCGEMAGNPTCFMILLGLGLVELSMNPVSIPRVKKLTRAVTFRHAKEILDRALDCRTAGEVEHLIKRETSRIQGFPKI